MRITLLVLIAVLALAAPARAATPAQANRRIAACMKARGALKVERTSGHEGTAFFGRPFNTAGRWVSWSFTTALDTNQVVRVNAASSRLSRLQKRAVNRCLRPYHGRL
ncbi:MAG TPA: hypothetical protein VJN72_07170 [Gaiellales bacterium]|nr:hypothetical protein [Gaiellales bacterium]